MRQLSLLFAVVIILTAVLLGCSDDPASSELTAIGVAFENTASSGSDGTVEGNPGDAIEQITITRARIVIGRIEFGGDATATYRSAEHEPVVVELDLSGSYHRLGYVEVPEGTYSSSLFRIQQLEPTDSVAWQRYPEMRNVSMRVEGYLNGDPGNTFLFTTELDEEQNRDFEPFTISTGVSHLAVFRFDHRDWFRDTDGSLLNPDNEQLAAGRSIVEDNIVQGFDVF